MTTTNQVQRETTRRTVLKAAGASVGLLICGRAVMSQSGAWGLEATALKPETIAALIKIARDLYPHDRVADRFYAIAIKRQDQLAGTNPVHKQSIEEGVSALDRLAGANGYRFLPNEQERVALLQSIEKTPFFQVVRSDLVVSLYNQKELWPLFGYEGESYSKGGYIRRGFDDIEWL